MFWCLSNITSDISVHTHRSSVKFLLQFCELTPFSQRSDFRSIHFRDNPPQIRTVFWMKHSLFVIIQIMSPYHWSITCKSIGFVHLIVPPQRNAEPAFSSWVKQRGFLCSHTTPVALSLSVTTNTRKCKEWSKDKQEKKKTPFTLWSIQLKSTGKRSPNSFWVTESWAMHCCLILLCDAKMSVLAICCYSYFLVIF